MFILAACGGGGGAGGGSSSGIDTVVEPGPTDNIVPVAGCTNSLASNFDPVANQEDGSCIGTPGQNSFYGFKADFTTFENEATAPDPTKNIVIPNRFYLKVGSGAELSGSTAANERNVDVAVHSPICRKGSDHQYYSMVALNSTSLTTVSVYVTADQVSLGLHTFDTGTQKRNEYFTYSALASSCKDGKVTIPDIQSELFENDDMAVLKLPEGVYVGIKGSALTPSFEALTGTYTAYSQTNGQYCTLSRCTDKTVSLASAFDSTSTIIDTKSDATFFGSGSLLSYSNANSSPDFGSNTSHGLLKGSQTSIYMPTIAGTVGGKSVLISAMPDRIEGAVWYGALGIVVGIK